MHHAELSMELARGEGVPLHQWLAARPSLRQVDAPERPVGRGGVGVPPIASGWPLASFWVSAVPNEGAQTTTGRGGFGFAAASGMTPRL